jgi:NAD(P)-dependent dehydrogenase (short-subunit alcohol dehydrogenase family)
MELRVDGKVAIVTGGSKGIGRAIAAALSEAGATVLITSRKAEQLAAAAAEIADATGREVSWFAANAGELDDIAGCTEAAIERHGAIDVLVNNAATNPYNGRVIDVDLPRLRKTMDVNLIGPLVWIQHAHRAWMRDHGGCVINVSSIGGMRPAGNVYSLTKAGLNFVTTSLAVELAPTGTRVNAIAPGLVQTDMARILWDTPDARIPPIGRIGQPPDIAATAVYLASDQAAWVTGAVFVIDGGALVGFSGAQPRALASS